VPKSLWKERYDHIADFEELLAEHGTVILKFFLHITKVEQEQRLLDREKEPETAWKLNPTTGRSANTGTITPRPTKTQSPGPRQARSVDGVPANSKWYRDFVIAQSIVAALRDHKENWKDKLDEMGRSGRAGLEAMRRARRGEEREEKGQVIAASVSRQNAMENTADGPRSESPGDKLD